MRKSVLSVPCSLLALAFTGLASAYGCGETESCFPYGKNKLSADLSVPNVPLEKWWCPQSMAYGFQGFSYPMEHPNCDAKINSFEQMDADFAQMKRDFGARVVRMYYPVCTDVVMFQRAIEAAAKNNMALIFQVWTNFGGGSVWKKSQQAIYDILKDPKYRDIIPYIVHSADFGSEPIGDGMDGGRDQFVRDLAKFRAHMHRHHIPAGISEDWDRPGIMSNGDDNGHLGTGLARTGKGVKHNSDYAHIHPMPFYHSNNSESEAWDYIKKETLWVKKHVGLPVTITETQWAWAPTSHYPDRNDTGVSQFTNFWKTIDGNCEWFKEQNVGWFFHSWRGEGSLDILYENGSYVIPDWRPTKC